MYHSSVQFIFWTCFLQARNLNSLFTCIMLHHHIRPWHSRFIVNKKSFSRITNLKNRWLILNLMQWKDYSKFGKGLNINIDIVTIGSDIYYGWILVFMLCWRFANVQIMSICLDKNCINATTANKNMFTYFRLIRS